MHPVVKWIAIGLAGVVAFLVVAAAIVWIVGGRRLHRTFEVEGHDLTVPSDSASVAAGERYALIYGCKDCHGADLGGEMLIDVPSFAVLPAPNLTSGEGGIAADYDVRDWERAIRHGVGPEGRGLVAMPSEVYAKLADSDLQSLLSYLRQLPPVNRSHAPRGFGPIARLAVMTGEDFLPAALIDHATTHPAAIEHGATRAFGEYYGAMCTGCHGEDFAGREGFGGGPPAANITPDSETGIGTWTYDDFQRAMRTGMRPDGTPIDSTMPWPVVGALTDDELQGLWMFLRDLEPVRSTPGPPRGPPS